MKLSRALLMALMLALASAAWAQPPGTPPPPSSSGSGQRMSPQSPPRPFKWWEDTKWRAELGLTNDQVARIEAIWAKTDPRIADGYSRLQPLETQLSKMISADDITEVDVLRHLDRIEAIRSEISKERTLMLFRMRRVLTPEQRTKLADMFSRHSDRGRGRSPQDSRH